MNILTAQLESIYVHVQLYHDLSIREYQCNCNNTLWQLFAFDVHRPFAGLLYWEQFL